MKTNNLFKTLILCSSVAGLLSLTSCESGDQDFPDFQHTTVYFANQSYVRTVELGEDPEVDLTNDNAHQISINVTMGGQYGNKQDIIVDFQVDPTLCDNVKFEDGNDITVMPSDYYSLESNQICIPKGSLQGGVKVHLTDAFFADVKSKENNYVIPLRITGVHGADSVLESKDYVLCAVKYVNPWQAKYLRRGVDKITGADGTVTTNVRHKLYVENDEVFTVSIYDLNRASMTVNVADDKGVNHPCQLLLTFDSSNRCTVSTLTDGFTVTGEGSFVEKGEKKSMGGKDRNALYLNYIISSAELNRKIETSDTMVVRNRGIAPEYFTVVEK